MNTKELFDEIYEYMINYDHARVPHGYSTDAISLLTRYNYYTYKEIINRKHPGSLNIEVDDKKVNDFKDRVDYYFEENSPGDYEYRDFIKYISLYLTSVHFRSRLLRILYPTPPTLNTSLPTSKRLKAI